MIWATILVLYIVAGIVTATLLYLHIQDDPEWAMGNANDRVAESNQVMAAVGATIAWPVTLIVFATMQARALWRRREVEA